MEEAQKGDPAKMAQDGKARLGYKIFEAFCTISALPMSTISLFLFHWAAQFCRDHNRFQTRSTAASFSSFVNSFIDFPKPLIALVNGPAVGIAVTTLALCDVVYSTDNVSIALSLKLCQSVKANDNVSIGEGRGNPLNLTFRANHKGLHL